MRMGFPSSSESLSNRDSRRERITGGEEGLDLAEVAELVVMVAVAIVLEVILVEEMGGVVI